MLPQAGHMSVLTSSGAPSGVRKRWRHWPHWYSLLPDIVVLPSRSHTEFVPGIPISRSGEDPDSPSVVL